MPFRRGRTKHLAHRPVAFSYRVGMYRCCEEQLGKKTQDHQQKLSWNCPQIVGMLPPSITYSLPVIEEARSDTRNATNSATSSGRLGRPSGIPPSESIRLCLATTVSVPAFVASLSLSAS